MTEEKKETFAEEKKERKRSPAKKIRRSSSDETINEDSFIFFSRARDGCVEAYPLRAIYNRLAVHR